MTTKTNPAFLIDLLDGVADRLAAIASDLPDLSSPAASEVLIALNATMRASVLLGEWEPHLDLQEHDAILDAVQHFILSQDGIPLPPDEHFDGAAIEVDAAGGEDWVRVTMPGCVYLVQSEMGIDGDDVVEQRYDVRGRYPQ